MRQRKLDQISKLLELKELRRKLKELEVARAQGAAYSAREALHHARTVQQTILNTSGERREKRINKLLQNPENVKVDSSRVVNVYRQTQEEIRASAKRTETRKIELEVAEDDLKKKQQKMARFLQMEERTRSLCERLKSQKLAESLRHE